MSSYQKPRIIHYPSTTNFNWKYFDKATISNTPKQYLVNPPPKRLDLVGKQFYWYSFSTNMIKTQSNNLIIFGAPTPSGIVFKIVKKVAGAISVYYLGIDLVPLLELIYRFSVALWNDDLEQIKNVGKDAFRSALTDIIMTALSADPETSYILENPFLNSTIRWVIGYISDACWDSWAQYGGSMEYYVTNTSNKTPSELNKMTIDWDYEYPVYSAITVPPNWYGIFVYTRAGYSIDGYWFCVFLYSNPNDLNSYYMKRFFHTSDNRTVWIEKYNGSWLMLAEGIAPRENLTVYFDHSGRDIDDTGYANNTT